MNKTKNWVKDRYFEYKSGDVVKLVRKKKNGHPRSLEIGKNYRVISVENDDLFVQDLDLENFKIEEIRGRKVNKNYFAPVINMRDELINDILKND